MGIIPTDRNPANYYLCNFLTKCIEINEFFKTNKLLEFLGVSLERVNYGIEQIDSQNRPLRDATQTRTICGAEITRPT